ncbi:bifunctional adenosylcobinamide kinase/adenosylcobinamide-phosphate guanylyltransferase [Desulfogranum japonicum]|uniref:bifunctional adenosylcobinamide kinase/adenosylcobinamide-phosphate guanylyltransferase n=1 Tax=Desulfogranum japonicum TaxID=231447 RepID=UPI00048E84F5|nr:bifunctional adenosylcobinamide kinase/adenosylcobinamide-phosphate guanylyltransferase [Desulfogranum japonicum]
MGVLTLITGGARSGKSSFAEELIRSAYTQVAYIATAQIFDQEMEERVRRHRQQRPDHWTTYEESCAPSSVFPLFDNTVDAVLLDCLTVLTTNLILQEQGMDWEAPDQVKLNAIEDRVMLEIENLLAACSRFSGKVFLVTNEVGLGIVPASPLSRFFRDCSGRVNQCVAARADMVYMVISGIPVKIKGEE